jgi:hypothetical protein
MQRGNVSILTHPLLYVFHFFRRELTKLLSNEIKEIDDFDKQGTIADSLISHFPLIFYSFSQDFELKNSTVSSFGYKSPY